MKLYKKKNY